MKKKDWIFTGVICLAAGMLWVAFHFFIPGDFHVVRIVVDGETFGVYSLDENRTISIGQGNICVIENGRAEMTEADCPDQLCVRQKAIDASGGTIICLPNRVVIEAETDSGASDENQMDAVAS